jgi:hypothetical protein
VRVDLADAARITTASALADSVLQAAIVPAGNVAAPHPDLSRC